MRILHVIPHYWPAVRYGGPIRSVHGLAAATAALGHDVHVYTTNVDGSGESDVPVGYPVDKDGVKITYFRTGLGRRVFRSPAMDRALEATVAGFDIVHIHYVWVWPTVAATAAARRYGVPYVLAPRGMLVPDMIRRRSMLQKRIWLALFDRRNVKRAAVIHVTADSEGAELCAVGLVPQRIEVIPNGVEIEEASSAEDPGVGILPDKPYVLYLGRINWKKGLDRLMRALAYVKDAELVIAGYDENGYQGAIERLASEVGVAGRVRFAGPVGGARKWALIRHAKCLVLPSYNENFGMAVVEAMAVGCPVVVTAEVGLAPIVAETGSGLVAAGGADELASAIRAVLSNERDRRAMGQAGQRAVRERFCWPGIARRMVAVYESCHAHSQ